MVEKVVYLLVNDTLSNYHNQVDIVNFLHENIIEIDYIKVDIDEEDMVVDNNKEDVIVKD